MEVPVFRKGYGVHAYSLLGTPDSSGFQWNSEFVSGQNFKPNVMGGKLAYSRWESYRHLT